MRGISILALGAGLAGLATSAPLAAQEGRINLRLAQGQPAKFVQGLCPLRLGNKKLETGFNSLKKAYDAKTPAERTTLLTDARTNIVTAITSEGQGSNGAAWYYLARTALMRGDAAEADSAFTKAEELAPTCELDIRTHRQNAWATLGTAGIELFKAGQSDSALVQLLDATLMFRDLPQVYQNIGLIFANTGRPDSAAVYFEKALRIAEVDSTLTAERADYAQLLASMYIRSQRYGDAVRLLHQTRSWDSTTILRIEAVLDSLKSTTATPASAQLADSLGRQLTQLRDKMNESERTLALTFRESGMTDSAEALEKRIIARFAVTNLDSLDVGDVIAFGASAFNSANYGEAARAFENAAGRNPWNWEVQYNLAVTYYEAARQAKDSADAIRKRATPARGQADPNRSRLAALDETTKQNLDKLVAQATKLLTIAPMNQDGLVLLSRGYVALNQDTLAVKASERLLALPFSARVISFDVSASSVSLSGEATGRSPMDPQGKPMTSKAVTLVFEFIGANGNVLDSKDVEIPVLSQGQKHTFTLEGTGTGIVGWRYKIKQN